MLLFFLIIIIIVLFLSQPTNQPESQYEPSSLWDLQHQRTMFEFSTKYTPTEEEELENAGRWASLLATTLLLNVPQTIHRKA